MIHLKEVTSENVFDVCELTTNKDGVGTVMEEYLCCNATSIAESKYYPEMHPKAIYDDDTLIGFFMYRHRACEPDTATICRFMIDYKFQGRGLGRKSLSSILSYFKQADISKVILMIDDNNTIAKKLYRAFGFTFNGRIEKDEFYYELRL